MDKKTLLDLKDGLRAAARVADNKLLAHGARVDEDDDPVFDRSRQRRQQRRERHTSLLRDWYDEKDSR